MQTDIFMMPHAPSRRPTIVYATFDSPYGPVAIAETAAGVAAVLFGTSEADLDRVIARHAPGAVRGPLRHAPAVLGALASGTTPDVPLDPQGTAFQKAVWNALRDIPAGETITYATLAARIGRPNAVRAVGAACGANPIAIVIPCHRVVGSSGKLTGYAYGIDMKRRLLERERGGTVV